MLMRLIDAKQQSLKLQRLRQQLRNELFEQCCELQRGPDSVDLDRLTTQLFDLKEVEARLGLERLTILDPRE